MAKPGTKTSTRSGFNPAILRSSKWEACKVRSIKFCNRSAVMMPLGSRVALITWYTVLIVPDEPNTDCHPSLRYSQLKSSILLTALWRACSKFSLEISPFGKNFWQSSHSPCDDFPLLRGEIVTDDHFGRATTNIDDQFTSAFGLSVANASINGFGFRLTADDINRIRKTAAA